MTRTIQPLPAAARRPALAALALAALTAALPACTGDEGATQVDAGLTLDAARPDAASEAPDASTRDSGALLPACDDPAVVPVPGGGVGGGHIRGRLVIFVRAAESGDPIEGATVVAQFDGANLTGTTDARGCLALEGPSAFGAGRVHVFAADRVYLSLLGFDAALATVNLQPRTASATPAVATVSGLVTGFEVLTASTATIARVGYVEPIPTSVFSAVPDQTVRDENPNVGANVVVVGRNGALDFRDYHVAVTPFETAGLAIRAGTIRFPRFGAPQVDLTHDGFLLGLDVHPDDALTGKDLPITHPLTESVTLAFGAAPDLPKLYTWSYVVLPGLSGWFYAGFAEGRDASGVNTFTGLPTLDGALLGATYGGVVEAASDTALSVLVDPGTPGPHLDLGDLPPVPTAIRAEGRALSAVVNASATDFVLFSLADTDGPVWTMAFVNTTPEPSITLPVPPEPFLDPLVGPLSLTVARTLYEGVNLEAFSFDDLSDAKIRALSGDTVTVSF